MSKPQTPEQLTVLYDGACPLCRREIAHVKGLAEKQSACGLAFVDISEPGVCGSSDEQATLLARFHVQRADGSRLSGAQAFVAMWSQLPGWRVLAAIARIPGMMTVMELSYRMFLKIRPGMQSIARRLEKPQAR